MLIPLVIWSLLFWVSVLFSRIYSDKFFNLFKMQRYFVFHRILSLLLFFFLQRNSLGTKTKLLMLPEAGPGFSLPRRPFAGLSVHHSPPQPALWRRSRHYRHPNCGPSWGPAPVTFTTWASRARCSCLFLSLSATNCSASTADFSILINSCETS